MFIGHYALAPLAAAPVFALKGEFKLWHGFLAVQLVDFVWAVFILLGLEKARVVEGFTQANALDLHFMPYTHSLLFTAFWALLGALGFKILSGSKSWRGSVLFAILVMSHWVGDVLVHVPDMTFWPGSVKVGFGLWNTLALSLPLELGLTFAAFVYYIKKTEPKSPRATLWASAFLGFLVILQLYSNFGPTPKSMHEVAISALLAFSCLVFCAARFETTRLLPALHGNLAPS